MQEFKKSSCKLSSDGHYQFSMLTRCLEGPLVVFIGNLLNNAFLLKAPRLLPAGESTLDLLDDLQMSQYDSYLCPDNMCALDATGTACAWPPSDQLTTWAPA